MVNGTQALLRQAVGAKPAMPEARWATRARLGEHPLRMEVGLGECHELACLLIPELELDGTNTVSDRHRRDAGEDGVGVVGALQVVVRDPGVEVMDMMQTDVAGEELQQLRELQIRAATQRGLGIAPLTLALPVGVLKLVLDVEQPDADRTRPTTPLAPTRSESPPSRSASTTLPR